MLPLPGLAQHRVQCPDGELLICPVRSAIGMNTSAGTGPRVLPHQRPAPTGAVAYAHLRLVGHGCRRDRVRAQFDLDIPEFRNLSSLMFGANAHRAGGAGLQPLGAARRNRVRGVPGTRDADRDVDLICVHPVERQISRRCSFCTASSAWPAFITRGNSGARGRYRCAV